MSNGAVKQPKDKLKDLAKERFPDLTPPEEQMLEAVAEGRWAKAPAGAASGAPAGTKWEIRGQVVRWVCSDGEAKKLVDPFGVQIEEAKITVDVNEYGERALNFSSLSIPFPLAFKKCTLPQRTWMFGMETTFLSFEGSDLGTLEADVLRIRGDLYLRGVTTKGVVRFPGASIGGDLDCSRSEFTNAPVLPEPTEGAPREVAKPISDLFAKDYAEQNDGVALHAEGVSVGGDVLLKGTTARGRVSLEGAKVEGDIDAENAQLLNPRKTNLLNSGLALDIDRANVKGSIYLRTDKEWGLPFRAEGEVRLLGAQVGSQFACSGGQFMNPKVKKESGEIDEEDEKSGDALSADGMTVKGPVFLRSCFQANGTVRLVGVTAAVVDCSEALFTHLDLHSAKIAGELDLSKMKSELKDVASATLDLTDASAGTLTDDVQSWPAPGGDRLRLDGFTYGRCTGGCGRAEDRLNWLGRQNQAKLTRQPYRQLAKVLKDEGDNNGMRRVLYRMEKRKSQREKAFFRQVWNAVLCGTVGYGYYPSRAFLWLAGSFLLGLLFYWNGFYAGYMVPTDKDAYAAIKAHSPLLAHYDRFHASIYSLENAFPVVKLGQADRWQVDPSPSAPVIPCLLRIFRWVQICAAWFFGAMGTAAVSGIVRKE